jgi:hypothetical protein
LKKGLPASGRAALSFARIHHPFSGSSERCPWT